jgi:hypothetical protein
MSLTEDSGFGAELASVHSDLEGKIERVGHQVASVRSDLEAKIEGVETSPLTEFHKCLSE